MLVLEEFINISCIITSKNLPLYQAEGSLTKNFQEEKYFNPVGLQKLIS